MSRTEPDLPSIHTPLAHENHPHDDREHRGRLRNIEAALRERGVEFEPAPLARSRGREQTPATPDELLAEHARWIEARQSAQTGGERQGASRRIHNLERQLTALGVAFQPAELSRPARRSPPPSATDDELLAAHEAALGAWRSARTAGVKAGATRRLRKIEAALRERGVERIGLVELVRGRTPQHWRLSLSARRRRRAWEKPELILAIDLYMHHGGQPPQEALEDTKAALDRWALANGYRPRPMGGLVFKLGNLYSIATRGAEGFSHGGAADLEVWNQYADDIPSLTNAVSALKSKLGHSLEA